MPEASTAGVAQLWKDHEFPPGDGQSVKRTVGSTLPASRADLRVNPRDQGVYGPDRATMLPEEEVCVGFLNIAVQQLDRPGPCQGQSQGDRDGCLSCPPFSGSHSQGQEWDSNSPLAQASDKSRKVAGEVSQIWIPAAWRT